MNFKPSFSFGEVFSNAVTTEAFKVGNMGGMCRLKTTGALDLIKKAFITINGMMAFCIIPVWGKLVTKP